MHQLDNRAFWTSPNYKIEKFYLSGKFRCCVGRLFAMGKPPWDMWERQHS